MTPADLDRQVAELQPCWFCKAPVRLHSMGSSAGVGYVQCHACQASGPIAHSGPEAIAKWNAVQSEDLAAAYRHLGTVVRALEPIVARRNEAETDFKAAHGTVPSIASAATISFHDLNEARSALDAIPAEIRGRIEG